MIEIEIINHQSEVSIPPEWLGVFHEGVLLALPQVLSHAKENSVWGTLDVLDIAFVDQKNSEKAHIDFMGVAGATDVITFLHGELVICPAIANQQAMEYGVPLAQELLRYMVHGMLHLAGHEDAEKQDREVMERAQELIIAALLTELSFSLN